MGLIKGISVVLIKRTQTGTDAIGNPIFTESRVTVKNVLVGNPSSSAEINSTNLYGVVNKMALGIPKGDTNTWEKSDVEFFGKRWRTVGGEVRGIESMIPLDWRGWIEVEAYG